MKTHLVRSWFLIALCTVLVVGISQANHLVQLSRLQWPRFTIVATVMFLMALPLDIHEMWRAMQRPGAPLLAAAVNFGLLPLLAWGLVALLGSWELLSTELRVGILVAATTPCTLASASVWTRRAGGNDSVAILVTVLTNATCFLITPLWLLVMTGQRAETESLQLSTMVIRLGLLVVAPMALAQLLRLSVRRVAHWASSRKIPLGVMAQCGVLSMVFLGAIRTGIRIASTRQLLIVDFLLMAVVVVAIHLCMLATAMWLARLCGFERRDRIAVGISGSQKTLMVGLQVGMDLGVSILPIVVYHVSQLFLDTLIADRLRRRGG